MDRNAGEVIGGKGEEGNGEGFVYVRASAVLSPSSRDLASRSPIPGSGYSLLYAGPL